MEGTYGVYFGNQQTGKVQVIRQGLYYRFICRCRLSGDILCCLEVSCGSKKENLGIVVPMDDGFGLDTKLPVKNLGQGSPMFFLMPRKPISEGSFTLISPEEPFSYISRLKDAFLIRKNGQVGILIRE